MMYGFRPDGHRCWCPFFDRVSDPKSDADKNHEQSQKNGFSTPRRVAADNQVGDKESRLRELIF